VATHVQASGRARATPQTAPPRMERYIEPGNENACRLTNKFNRETELGENGALTRDKQTRSTKKRGMDIYLDTSSIGGLMLVAERMIWVSSTNPDPP